MGRKDKEQKSYHRYHTKDGRCRRASRRIERNGIEERIHFLFCVVSADDRTTAFSRQISFFICLCVCVCGACRVYVWGRGVVEM